MYNNDYNRRIASQLDKINKHFIKHQGEQGMAPYAKGEGMSGGGFSLMSLLPFILGGAGKPHDATVCHHCKGSGMLSQMLGSFGFGKEHPRHMAGEGISGSGLLSGLLGSFGFGEPHNKKGRRRNIGRVEPESAEGMDGSGLISGLVNSWGLGHPKKGRGRPRKANTTAATGATKRRGNPALAKRAELVKKVMHEQGLSMINASKYIKTHNLY